MGHRDDHALLIADYNEFISPLFNALFSCFIAPKNNNETAAPTKTHLIKPITHFIDVMPLPPAVSGLITDLVATTAGATEEHAAKVNKKNLEKFKKSVAGKVYYTAQIPVYFQAPLETQLAALQALNQVFTDINTTITDANDLMISILEASSSAVGEYIKESTQLRASLPGLIKRMFACASDIMKIISHHFGHTYKRLPEEALLQIAQLKVAQTKLLTRIEEMASIEVIRKAHQADLLELAGDYSVNWNICLKYANTSVNIASEPLSAGEPSKDKGKQKRAKSTSFSDGKKAGSDDSITSSTKISEGESSTSSAKATKRTKKSFSFSFGFKGRSKTELELPISAPTPIAGRGGLNELDLPKAADAPLPPPPAPKTRAPTKQLSRLIVPDSPILSKKITDSPVLSGLSLSPRGSHDDVPPLSLESTPAPAPVPAEDGSDSPGYIRIARQRRT